MPTCLQKYKRKIGSFQAGGGMYCNATWDGYMCWPPTAANTTIRQHCPPVRGLDIREYVRRVCDESGHWFESNHSDHQDGRPGWTDYSVCYTSEMKDLLNMSDLHEKMEIANTTRIIEFVGYTSSLLLILISLAIFSLFRSLKNHRTTIHKHLMVAMLIQATIRLSVYTDQNMLGNYVGHQGIHTSPILCEGAYVVLEFAKTSMFMWFFVEGFYLNEVVVVATLSFKPNYALYYLIGWGFPVLITIIWSVVTSVNMSHTLCWAFYSKTSYFWIIEGPRLCVLFINLLFLLATLRILISKLNHANNRRFRRIMKAVRAAFVLVPLLGISNGLMMIDTQKQSLVVFGTWAVTSHFLSSFQGVFIALLYCIFNKEVRSRLKKEWKKIKAPDKDQQVEDNLKEIGNEGDKGTNVASLEGGRKTERKMTLQTNSCPN